MEGVQWRRRWKAVQTLPRGHKLYHGTNASFDPDDDDLIAPAWFSSSQSVARHFARGGAIREYVLTAPIVLPVITSRSDRARFFETFDIADAGAEDMADDMGRSGLPGWIIPNNYPDGDDILLVNLLSLSRLPDAAIKQPTHPHTSAW